MRDHRPDADLRRGDPLAAGRAYPTIEFDVRVDPDTDDEELFNTARVDGGGDGNKLNNESTDSGKLRRPDLAVDKLPTSRSCTPAGQPRSPSASPTSALGGDERHAHGRAARRPDAARDHDQPGHVHARSSRSAASSAARRRRAGTLRLTTLVGASQAGLAAARQPRRAWISTSATRSWETIPTRHRSTKCSPSSTSPSTRSTATPTVPAGNDVAFTITVTTRGLTRQQRPAQDVLPPGLTVKSADRHPGLVHHRRPDHVRAREPRRRGVRAGGAHRDVQPGSPGRR